jgi:DNA (cytosine-5)-methyltransferase 1
MWWYQPVKYYIPKDNVDEIPEEKAYINLGEDPDAEDDKDKPVRLLTDFCIFDPKHDMELISLSELEKDDGTLDREIEGAGDVRSFILNDEDAGQEDDLDDEQVSRIRLSAIMRYTIDYTQDDEWVSLIFYAEA